MPKPFAALPGFYYYFFLYLEPLSSFAPSMTCLFYPGTAWFYHELVPSPLPAPTSIVGLEARTVAAIWQLANTYMLLSLLQALGFRTLRDALPHDPAAQERILGTSMMVLMFADLTHIAVTLLAAPKDIRFNVSQWNGMSHGNTTAVFVLFIVRLAWLLGIGRTRYYFGKQQAEAKKIR